MAKIQNISEIHPTLGFTEFDILKNYRKSFNESELGRLHSVFPFERMAKALGLSKQRLGRRNIFSPSAKIALMVLKAYTGFSDRQLLEHLNGKQSLNEVGRNAVSGQPFIHKLFFQMFQHIVVSSTYGIHQISIPIGWTDDQIGSGWTLHSK